MHPAKRQLKLSESRRAFEAGDIAAAERICLGLLRVNRADTLALHTLAVIASARGDDAAACRHLERCVALDPRHAMFHNDLARAHALAGRYPQAIASLQRALALQPGNVQALTDLADVLERGGEHERAWALLEPLVRSGSINDDMAPVLMRLMDRAGDTNQAIDLGRRLLQGPGSSPAARRFLLQALGRLLDKQGEYRAAFEAFAEAKRPDAQHFDPARHARDIDALIAAWSPAALARLPRPRQRSELPVFLACMPRSGSTLVEQIIHAHPNAWGAGEHPQLHRTVATLPAAVGSLLPYPQCLGALDEPTVTRLAAEYLQAIAPPAPRQPVRVTNKHLLNTLHLGMAATLFPGTRVIHVHRDAMDHGLGCFMTSLSPAIMPWAGDLAHIAAARRHNDRLVKHWRQTLDVAWLDVRYEDLVDDIDTQARRIIDFCGLPWDERCLRYWEAERVVLTPSYDQVRRPIYRTAVGRWRHYAEFLQPLRAGLEKD